MNCHKITLPNDWIAEFNNTGEFHMGAEGWGLLLTGPNQNRINYFNDQVVLVNDDEGVHARSCIRLSDNGVYGYLTTAVDSSWVIDFSRGMIAPHRISIHQRHDGYDETVSVHEQPAFKRTRQYLSVSGKHIYLTFPFTRDEDFPTVWEEYLSIRRRQIDELYFRN
ncbi:hypothetical protein C1X59_29745 [Pseudomonas sp. FW215-R2]|jgi:hypothetical protein|uniref:hypothetical protein n=1 Tax=unclassified Pseudomonas TaxID=196821 RepID=UPI000C88EE77|nr:MULTISPECIES: hypothetical protein [unclassified Pseudomonas]PMW93491.1 hypothetical protein C1X59_29745 [Pseudomonas sp. FW215-R2]PMX04733.1 hypothetical protein C1X60_29795 [Pseudomonas sp. FW215-L1]PMX15876.1 hypothetical protein C1X57_29590 [Pseudomonas sp. FW215-E1]PNA20618.1 hypothetical protein C1X58_29620 [Pseudomonas sp. FW215-R4]